MKTNLILFIGLIFFASCDKDDDKENDKNAPNITEILHDGIDVKGDAFEVAQGDKLQLTINAEDHGVIKKLHVTVYQTESTGEGMNTDPLEFNETYTIDQFEVASHVVLVAAKISATTDLGIYKVDVELEDNSGNMGVSTTSFTLVAATVL